MKKEPTTFILFVWFFVNLYIKYFIIIAMSDNSLADELGLAII